MENNEINGWHLFHGLPGASLLSQALPHMPNPTSQHVKPRARLALFRLRRGLTKHTSTQGLGVQKAVKMAYKIRLTKTDLEINQWLFLVPLKGGRWHIIPQLAVYTT